MKCNNDDKVRSIDSENFATATAATASSALSSFTGTLSSTFSPSQFDGDLFWGRQINLRFVENVPKITEYRSRTWLLVEVAVQAADR